MKAKPLRPDLAKYLKKHNLQTKFEKQRNYFIENPNHPSLNTEKLEPKSLNIYSFRMDKKYRAIFILTGPEEIEIVDINDHYQ